MFEGDEDAGAFEAAALAGSLGAADGDDARAVAAPIEAADADEAHEAPAEGDEAGADAAAIEEEEAMDAADRQGLLFAAVAIILTVILAVETAAFTVAAFEAGAFAGALGVADGDEAAEIEEADGDEWRAAAAAIEAADADEARALADAIEAAEAAEAGAAAGEIEEEELDAGDHRAILFAAVGVLIAVVVAVATVAYTPPPPAAGRAPAYPGHATNVLPTPGDGILGFGQFPKGGTGMWAGLGSGSMQQDASPGRKINYALGPADARLPRLSRGFARLFVRPTSLLLTALVYTAYCHARLHFLDYAMLVLVAAMTALVLYVDGASVQLGPYNTADEGLLSWIEALVPNMMRYLRRG